MKELIPNCAVLMDSKTVVDAATARVESILDYRQQSARRHRRITGVLASRLRQRSLLCMIFGRHKSDRELLRWHFGPDLGRYPLWYQQSLHDSESSHEHELQVCRTLADMALHSKDGTVWVTDVAYQCLSL